MSIFYAILDAFDSFDYWVVSFLRDMSEIICAVLALLEAITKGMNEWVVFYKVLMSYFVHK